jgi:ubiquinone/menaquinone biosynthesis C-methylase UbiE
MEDSAYEAEARVEAEHWWFRGRRLLFAAELNALEFEGTGKILDVGTGTGSNLRMLRDEGYQNVVGIDLNILAISYCLTKGFTSVLMGNATNLPFVDSQFDMVLATDTIEHIDDDRKALHEIYRVLAPGGYAMVAVPAFPSLWGLQDIVAYHKRRYRMSDLRAKIESTGFEIQRGYHFNYLLFPLIWLARRAIKIFGVKRASESEFNSPLLNQLLFRTFAFDVRTAPVLRPPFGVSILIVAQKPSHRSS